MSRGFTDPDRGLIPCAAVPFAPDGPDELSRESIKMRRKRKRSQVRIDEFEADCSSPGAAATLARERRTPALMSILASEPTRRLSSLVPMPPPRLSSRIRMLDFPQELLIVADNVFRNTIRS